VDDGRPDVDVRFLLANERTLLAWTRTALALLAGGGALTQLSDDLRGRTAMAVTVTAIGIATVVTGVVRFARTQRALMRGEVPRSGLGPYVLSGAVSVVGIGLIIGIIAAR
jgi:putative membrane protein